MQAMSLPFDVAFFVYQRRREVRRLARVVLSESLPIVVEVSSYHSHGNPS